MFCRDVVACVRRVGLVMPQPVTLPPLTLPNLMAPPALMPEPAQPPTLVSGERRKRRRFGQF